MDPASVLHFVAISSRDRAEQARIGFDLGYHAEVYNDAEELKARLPDRGVVIAQDVSERGGIERIVDLLEGNGRWLPVIATAENPRPDRVVRAIKHGAIDYLALPLRTRRLASALEQIAREVEAHGEARRRMVAARERISNLTAREREVLDWLSEGCSNKMIARELRISPRTVEIHRANMMGKLGAHHAAEAVRIRLEAGERVSGMPNADPEGALHLAKPRPARQ